MRQRRVECDASRQRSYLASNGPGSSLTTLGIFGCNPKHLLEGDLRGFLEVWITTLFARAGLSRTAGMETSRFSPPLPLHRPKLLRQNYKSSFQYYAGPSKSKIMHLCLQCCKQQKQLLEAAIRHWYLDPRIFAFLVSHCLDFDHLGRNPIGAEDEPTALPTPHKHQLLQSAMTLRHAVSRPNDPSLCLLHFISSFRTTPPVLKGACWWLHSQGLVLNRKYQGREQHGKGLLSPWLASTKWMSASLKSNPLRSHSIVVS